MKGKIFKSNYGKRGRVITLKILFIFAFICALHVSHTHALAGMAESVYRYEYSPGLRLNIGAPSDMCPAEYGNQRCMWVESVIYNDFSKQIRSPRFVNIADQFGSYIVGQLYDDKKWALFNIKENKIEYTTESEDEIKAKVRELGGSDTFYTLQEAKNHFKKVKEPFDLIIFLIDALLLIIIISVPAGIIFGIYTIIKKIFYPIKNNPIAQVDVTVNTSVPTSLPTETISEAVIIPTATKLTPPSFTNNADVFKKLGAIVFILLAFIYVGNNFMSSSGDFSFASMFPKNNPLGGKALAKKISNKEIIKDVKSLMVLDEKEGLLKDNKAVYRCSFELFVYQNCVIQEVVKHPESFSRVTNIFGKDSESVYVIDEKTNNYKVLKEASAPTFRPLYNGMTESLMGLYAGDDFHLFKGEKILTIKSVPTGMTDALFYKEYKRGEVDAPGRHPYSRMAKGFDGDIQYMADDQFMYHGDGKASSTDPFIHLTKVEGADLKTFTYYQQKMLGTAYLKYATDKNNVYCDNVTLGSDGYFTSDGLTIIKDPNPKSFKVIYPTDPITERNANLQVAKTDSQVFVNCSPQPHIDADTFEMADAGLFADKHGTYDIDTSSTTHQETLVAFRTESDAILTKGFDRSISNNKTYDTTKFCDLGVASKSVVKGWNGRWYEKGSDYFNKQTLDICTNSDDSLYFSIDQSNLFAVAEITGVAKIVDSGRADGIGLDGESSKERNPALDCQITFFKSVATISIKIDGKECNLYSGARANIYNAEFRNDIDVTTVPSLQYKEVENQQFEGDRKETQDEKYVFKDNEYAEFTKVVGGYLFDFSKTFEQFYILSKDKTLKTRVYWGGNRKESKGLIMIGDGNKIWTIIIYSDPKNNNQQVVRYFTNVPESKQKLPDSFVDWAKNSQYPYDGSGSVEKEVIYMSK